MRLLLDTHTLLWWWANDPQLSEAARAAMLDESNEVHVSAASTWEIATRQRIGKLPTWPMQVVGSPNSLVPTASSTCPLGPPMRGAPEAWTGRTEIPSTACWPPRPCSTV